MLRVLIITKDAEGIRELHSDLICTGFACSFVHDGLDFPTEVIKQAWDVLLIAIDGSPASAKTESMLQQLRELIMVRNIPVIALISDKELNYFDSNMEVDDFVVKPWNLAEVVTRMKRAIKLKNNTQGSDLIKCGDLMIDTAKCEVSIGGKLLTLTFKEYELLKFLAKNRGMVFTREALLNEVWGYDYYGGDRTVDVHIRRLRSKLSDCTNSYIQTVRNIGYKFSREM